MADIVLLIASVIVGFLLVGAAAVLFVRTRMAKTVKVLEKRVMNDGCSIRLPAVSARYSGADSGYSKVKNNGVLVVGDLRLYFQHFLEKRPSIVIPLADIRNATVESSFLGESRVVADGGYLIVHTGDNNRIGFLLKDPEVVRAKLRPD
ncbi:MAG: hypothetical protein A2X84_04625 [Desulfuromonadaceae bacterium GWC2_58_13]|nr:MAG: hypothetical protein A2X84_04625 [Desulfuromonadaceae bacterium GWC2_58_13]